MKNLFYLNKYIWHHKWKFFLGLFFVASSNYFGVLSPQVIRLAFDLVEENIKINALLKGYSLKDDFYGVFTSYVLFFGILLCVLAIIRGVLMYFMRQTIIVMSRHIEFDLKTDIYDHYQKLPQSFYKKNATGDMMNRLTEDVSRVRMYLGPAIMYAFNLAATLLFVIIAMLQVDSTLTLFVLIPLPLLSVSIYYVSHLMNQRSEAIQKQLSYLTTLAQEFYSGIRVVKSYVREKFVNHQFREESEAFKNYSLRLVKVDALFFPLMTLLIGMSTILTIYVGGIGVMNGTVSPGNIAEFVVYVNMLTWPVTSLGWVTSLIQRAEASQKRINEFLQTKPDISTLENSRQLNFSTDICFQNISFTYPDTGIKALSNINFTITKGEKLAVIGRTGSGKSSLADLLLRLYDPQKGEILIDGQPLRNYSVSSIRENIAYVPQDVFLFSDTVKSNVMFGVKEAKPGEIEEATKNAMVYEEIMRLEKKFDTIVGERGVTLSGGQKQRLSIARALLKESPILVLDDCLSAVDANTEQAIYENFEKFFSTRTVLLITHRLFILQRFDRILVLDNGEIAEQGTHESLMNGKGYYYDLYMKQKQEEKILT